MKFEWTVNIGNILTVVGLFVGFYVAHIQNIKKLAKIEEQVSLMYSWFRTKIVNYRERDDRDRHE